VATKAKKPAAKKPSAKQSTTITRISASDLAPTKKVSKAVKKPAKKVKTNSSSKTPIRGLKTLFAIGGYFKGAWFELKQVRWPNRRATWSLTGAVLLFTAFFVVLVVLLDVLFKFLFELILK
jgi:preprotein translocase SecE subunit